MVCTKKPPHISSLVLIRKSAIIAHTLSCPTPPECSYKHALLQRSLWLSQQCICLHPEPASKNSAEGRRTSPVSPGKMGTICRDVVPSNTKKATSWAFRVFEEWRRERNATATGEQCPLELLEKLTGCRSVTLPSPRHEQPKISPYSPLQMVPIFPGETGEVNRRFAGDFFFTSGLQQRHTEQNGSPRQDALEHISRPRSSTHDKEAPLKLVTMPTL